MKLYKLIVSLGTLMLVACGGSDDFQIPDRPAPEPAVITIDPSVTYQTIAGFGGANQMWGTQFPNADDMQKTFGMGDSELGFSIFRIRIASNPNEWPLIVDVAKEALKYEAKILASPWSPPAALKSNNSDISGRLEEENYEAFANHINDFIDFMSENDVEIYAISIQNEPDIEVSYESCDWTATEMNNFIKGYGHLIKTKIAAPESFNFNQGFSNVLLNDEETVEQLDIVAGHIYGGGQNAYPLAESKGKEIWMTEYLMNLNVGDWEGADEETKWDETMIMLGTLHTAMVNNWNAYIWWYLKRYYSFIGDGDEGTTEGEILKRGYAFSHFSKFIRPGFVRVKTIDEDNLGLGTTAYKEENEIVLVLINSSDVSFSGFDISVVDAAISSAKIYTTSLSANREIRELSVDEGNVNISIPGNSVATVVINLP